MASDNLNLTQMTGAENEKTNLINDIFQQLEDALTEQLSIAVAGVTLILTADQCHRYMVYEFTGTPGAARDVEVLDDKKLYICENAVTDGSVLRVKTNAGTGIYLAQGVKKILYCDGTNVTDVGASAQLLQTFGFGENGGVGPHASGIYMRAAGWQPTSTLIGYVATRAGWVVGVGVDLEAVTDPAGGGTLDVEVLVAGVAVFSVTITTNGTPARWKAYATQGPGIDAVAAGDTISVRVTFGTFTGTWNDGIAHVELATSL